MTAYLQMGHHSENLLADPGLRRFKGVILSPVNNVEVEIARQISEAGGELETVFDPQLYFPHSERGCLRRWNYFPKDVDTADLSSEAWWSTVVEGIAATCLALRPTAVCSPALVPRVHTNEYFDMMVRVGQQFYRELEGSGIRTLQTAVVDLSDLTTPGRSLEIASILTRTYLEEVYLILVGDTEPRRELRDVEELKGAMRLVAELERSGMRTVVGFTSTDLVLWKAAGASACASGKFFNLRRFTSSRFEEPSQGGGQLPYWCEESLLAFLREADVIRLLRAGKLGPERLANPFSVEILNHLEVSPGVAWLAKSWRQFLYAFSDLELRLTSGLTDPADLLANAEKAWLALDDAGFLMEEPRNDGSWLRPWRRALAEYRA